MPARTLALLVTTVLAVGLVGCDKSSDHDHDHDHAGHGHHHSAPHGGTLIAIGDHVAHLELSLDPVSGTLALWVLDGEAEAPLRSEAKTITLMNVMRTVKPGGSVGDALAFDPFDLTLEAVANELTGETVGDSGTFTATDERLVGLERFTAKMSTVAIPGGGDTTLLIAYPEGNEK